MLLGDYLDEQLRAYVAEILQLGLVVNTSVLIVAARGLVLHHDSNWLRLRVIWLLLNINFSGVIFILAYKPMITFRFTLWLLPVMNTSIKD